jgi:hypothetical protein
MSQHKYHIVPIGDSRKHEIDAKCWCCPEEDEDDPDILIHNAMDGREDYEDGIRKHH